MQSYGREPAVLLQGLKSATSHRLGRPESGVDFLIVLPMMGCPLEAIRCDYDDKLLGRVSAQAAITK